MFHVDLKWKISRDELQKIGVKNIIDWVSGGDDIINTLSSI